MFEKEAEDKAFEKYPLSDRCDRIDLERNLKYEEGFKDGAEFGYNKAKVEVEESYRESLCNSECNLASVTEKLEELKKANEWHKVTEKLPEHENLVCNQDGEPCWYDSETDQWLDIEGTRTKTTEWCDMPHKESE